MSDDFRLALADLKAILTEAEYSDFLQRLEAADYDPKVASSSF